MKGTADTMARVLLLHNHYQQPGGEDAVFTSECELLESRGHAVRRMTVHNSDLANRSPLGNGVNTIWNRRQHRAVRQAIREHRADIVHCHNTFPQYSPSVYYAARAEGVPVVQTLHNFRLTCVNGLLFRNGAPCTACVGSFAPWRGVTKACYRGDHAASAVAATMVALHRRAGTYANAVDRYIALTDFARDRFVAAGIPADRIDVKPNFAPDPFRESAAAEPPREGFLYVGRLSAEKGPLWLADAASRMGSEATVTIVGDGPLRGEIEAAGGANARLRVFGSRSRSDVQHLMRHATAVVIPSLCFEMFPVVAAEAFAAGCPVIASDHGGLASIVTEGVTGRLVPPGDAPALAAALDRLGSEPGEAARMGQRARRRYEEAYSPDATYARLDAIYRDVLAARSAA